MKQFKKIGFFIAAFVGLSCIFSYAPFLMDAQAEVYIIANTSVQQNTLSKEEIKKIFLGRKVTWNDTLQVMPVTLQRDAIHEEFVRKFTGKTTAQFTSYWRKMLFSGSGSTPDNAQTVKEVIHYVSTTKGAIGYIPSPTTADNVKIIQVND